MIRFYFALAPNPRKVALFLEESGLPYEAVPVDTRRGEQHAAAFRAINPNGKTPAIVDTEGPGGKAVRVQRISGLSKIARKDAPCGPNLANRLRVILDSKLRPGSQ